MEFCANAEMHPSDSNKSTDVVSPQGGLYVQSDTPHSYWQKAGLLVLPKMSLCLGAWRVILPKISCCLRSREVILPKLSFCLKPRAVILPSLHRAQHLPTLFS